MPQTVGLIEVSGLAGAIQAADAAVKAADVKLIGYELSKGFGLVTIKLIGNIAAVKAAVEAGAAAVTACGGNVHSKLVIPRPAAALEILIHSRETVSIPKADLLPSVPEETIVEEIQVTDEQESDVVESTEPVDDREGDAVDDSNAVSAEEESKATDIDEEEYKETNLIEQTDSVCNLCGDPLCPRRKGEPRVKCIHISSFKEV